MRIKEKRFSVPFCIFKEPLTGEGFRLLCFLLSQTDFSGKCAPGYTLIKAETGIGSDATVALLLRHLKRLGWIYIRKRSNGRPETFFMRVPPHYQRPGATAPVIKALFKK